MSMNALDTALVKLAASSTSLEKHKPGIKDVEEAKKAAKDAAEILESAHKLMLYGIYSVADAPADPFLDTAEHEIYLPVVVNDSPAELPPLPEELALFDTWDEADALDTFSAHLDALNDRLEEDFRGKDEDFAPWDTAWDADRKDAFTRLLVAEARELASMALPTDEERDTWLAQFAPTEVPTEEPVDFEAKLLELEEHGVSEAGLKRKAWKKAEATWREAYEADPAGTVERLLWRLQQASISWELPTDEEMAPELETAVGEE